MNTTEICENPVFIIGAPRSGTTALAWALAQHSRLWTSDESQIIWDLFGDGRLDKNYKRQGKSDGSWLQKQGISQSEFRRFMGIGLNALFSSQSHGKRWVDQTPAHTLLVDTLADMFPGAYFIHILRDGRRVVNSMAHYLDQSTPAPGEAPAKGAPQGPAWARDFREACRTWSRFVRLAMDFSSRNPDRCVTVLNERRSGRQNWGSAGSLARLRSPTKLGRSNSSGLIG